MIDDAMGLTVRSESQIHALRQKIEEITWNFEYDEVFSLSEGTRSSWAMRDTTFWARVL